MITYLDAQVGTILDTLQEIGADERTLVVFTSDNGGTFNIGGAPTDFFESNGPLRGHKTNLYEGGIRVPMIARWPGRIRAGATSDHVGANWDLWATFAELAGAAAPAGTDGISIVPDAARPQGPAAARGALLGVSCERRFPGRAHGPLEGNPQPCHEEAERADRAVRSRTRREREERRGRRERRRRPAHRGAHSCLCIRASAEAACSNFDGIKWTSSTASCEFSEPRVADLTHCRSMRPCS